jgi:predicted nucleic acid-binding protein
MTTSRELAALDTNVLVYALYADADRVLGPTALNVR